MTLIFVALIAVIVTLVVVIDRQQSRFHEAERAHRLEVLSLLERVRSPELARPEPKVPDVEEVPAVTFDDDRAFWDAKGVTSGDTR